MFFIVLAFAWFMGFGWGSNRHGINNTALILNNIHIVESYFSDPKGYLSDLVVGFTTPSVLVTVLLMLVVVMGSGYFVGKRWFQT